MNKNFISLILFALLAVFIRFRDIFLSAFDRVPGDWTDGRLILGINEHWYRVFSGLEKWNDLGMFYPIKGTLGYSDTFFLNGLFFSLLRFLGFDTYRSQQLSLITLCLIGFIGIYLLLKNTLKCRNALALWAGLFFCISSPIFMAGFNSHLQLLSLWYLPWVLILFLHSYQEFDKQEKRGLILASSGSLLLALILFNTFYMGWFFIFFTCLCAIIFFILSVLSSINPKPKQKIYLANVYTNLNQQWHEIWALCFAKRKLLFFSMGLFLIGMLPFFILYLPIVNQRGGQPISSAMRTLPSLIDFINVGNVNIIWGSLFEKLNLYSRELYWELRLGLPPITLSLFCIAGILHLRRRNRSLRHKSMLILFLAVLLSYILMLKIDGHSLWYFIYHYVPGASVIRAVFRYNIFLTFPIILVITTAIDSYFDFPAQKYHKLKKGVICSILAFILIEQIQLSSERNMLSRSNALNLVKSLPDPPSDCQLFYVSENRYLDWGAHHNINAFQLSQIINIPTVCGYSGVFPEHWNFSSPTEEDYRTKIIVWSLRNNIKGPLYEFNWNTKSWHGPIPLNSEITSIDLDKNLIKSKKLFWSYCVSGWSNPENWGIWSDGKEAQLKIPLENTLLKEKLRLNLVLNAFLKKTHPSQKVQISLNGKKLYEGEFVFEKTHKLNISLDIEQLSEPELNLVFHNLNPGSPADHSPNTNDNRQLGIGLKKISIQRALK